MIEAGRPVIIREAKLEDVPHLVKLIRSKGIKENLPDIRGNYLEHDIEQRLQGSTRHHLLVAECDGAIVGYTRFLHRLRPEKDGSWQTTAHETAVLPIYRGRGIGRMLVEARLQNTLEHDKGKQDYITFKAPADIAANRFHLAQGAKIYSVEEGARPLNVYRLSLPRHRELSKPEQTLQEGIGR